MTSDSRTMEPPRPAPREAGSRPETAPLSAPPPAASPARLPALDGLRALAVLLVLVMHYYVVVPGPDDSALHRFLQRIGSLSFVGVDLFFVLSGYFIGGILLDFRESPKLLPAFYARRFFRIVPLYLLLLASYFVFRHVPGLATLNFGTYFNSPVPEWSYAVFAQNIAMATARDIGPYWLGPTWSLAVEEQFYLLMPLIVLRFASRPLIVVCLAAIVLCPLLRWIAHDYAQNNLAAVFLTPARADGLLWGVLCAIVMRQPAALAWVRRHARNHAALLGGLTVLLVALAWSQPAADSRTMVTVGYSAVGFAFAALVLFVAAHPSSRLARLCSARPLAAIGLGSYFIYLFHTPVWYLLHWALVGRTPRHVTWTGGAITLLAVVATLALAAASWRWLESPLLQHARRRFRYE